MAHALIFDSGVGGLSVVSEIRARLPDVHLSYIADDEFRPYGDKSEAELQARLPGLLWACVDMLRPDVVVIACNTASTAALAAIRAELDVPVIGVVPAIKPAAQLSESRTLGVLGTPGTIKRRYVNQLIADFATDCHVALHGSVALVAWAERKLSGQEINPSALARDIAPLFEGPQGQNVDTVVLSCTHFPLLAEELAQAAPHIAHWVDSGAAIAKRLQSVLADMTALHPRPQGPETAFSIGEDISPVRRKSFQHYGFTRTITLPASH